MLEWDDPETWIVPDKPVGFYGDLGDEIVGLARLVDDLYFLRGGVQYLITRDCKTEYSKHAETSRFSISVAGHHFVYEYPAGVPISTPFYAEDDLDVDFGLWLHDVLSSQERTDYFRENWKNGM